MNTRVPCSRVIACDREGSIYWSKDCYQEDQSRTVQRWIRHVCCSWGQIPARAEAPECHWGAFVSSASVTGISFSKRHLPKLLDVFSSKTNLNLVLEFLDSDLEMIIKDRSLVFLPADIKAWMAMTFRGLEFCHRNFILHRVRLRFPIFLHSTSYMFVTERISNPTTYSSPLTANSKSPTLASQGTLQIQDTKWHVKSSHGMVGFWYHFPQHFQFWQSPFVSSTMTDGIDPPNCFLAAGIMVLLWTSGRWGVYSPNSCCGSRICRVRATWTSLKQYSERWERQLRKIGRWVNNVHFKFNMHILRYASCRATRSCLTMFLLVSSQNLSCATFSQQQAPIL